jgi:hypothetical protein
MAAQAPGGCAPSAMLTALINSSTVTRLLPLQSPTQTGVGVAGGAVAVAAGAVAVAVGSVVAV